MSTVPASIARADYGIDAPGVVRNLALIGLAGVIAIIVGVLSPATQDSLAGTLVGLGLTAVIIGLGQTALMVWSSKFGKYRMRERLLDNLHLRGDEQVLDVGCGRGLILNAAARRLPNGRATGIDLWQNEDQSHNAPEATLANARIEGVAERVAVKSGDMQQMPFSDGTFDAVVSSLAIHNIYNADGRKHAIGEIARVLRPGGKVALLDFRHTAAYAQALRDLGWHDVQLSGVQLLMFPPVRVVYGTKPGTNT